MKTYLITGGAGFIGSNYIHYLMQHLKEEIRIINLDALTYCARSANVSCYEGSSAYRFVKGDICEEALLEELFAKNDIDYVVHFAAHSHVDRSIRSPKEFARVNVCGTLSLLDAAKNAWERDFSGKRFLYISTDEVYGELKGPGKFTENTPVQPRNPYSASKAGGDHMARAYYETYGLPVLVTRCSNNYGPYQYQEKFIPNCILCCQKGQPIPVYGDGLNIRNWLYVSDHLSAIDKVLKEGRIGEVYNIGAEKDYTNLEIINSITSILKNEYQMSIPSIEFIEDRKGHDRRYSMDAAKLQKELGWKQEVSFEEGIRRTVGWYMENRDFMDSPAIPSH
ncbi:dTDP-glucose 4,6-dehydratase [Anaerocolumna jejuensis DSM 15929]|uniref:dTDP-glucose 4,6-dehydratase n=1 Tax=Anaerocolumna jejuensis DSM 15929 TaxID=1121322 RepID=A0A1M6PLT1_9FIRM|nr:dTDP-glucose 4,6-dehydratase [Anaerocolumna jejuensis]SHK08880.1 dTDP-glucose 4,6-dehydratase [Anaerocolumna jejuensis DSM 15929]